MAIDASRMTSKFKQKLEGIFKISITDDRAIVALMETIVEELQANLEATNVELDLGGDTAKSLYVDNPQAIPPTQDANTAVPVDNTKSFVKGKTRVGTIAKGNIK